MNKGIAKSKAATDGRWIGHYGCGRLVKVATVNPTGKKLNGYTLPKLAYSVECPACGREHRVKVMWRAPKDADELGRAEVRV